MSEFTAGVLFLRKHTDKATAALQTISQPYIVKELNSQWMALFPKNDNIRSEALHGWLLEQSKVFPLLYFQHPEDHGWGYNLFSNGEETASLFVDHEVAYQMFLHVTEFLYPGIDPHSNLELDLIKTINDIIYESARYKQEMQKLFNNVNVDAFAVFELDNPILDELRSIVTAEHYLSAKDSKSQIQDFMAAINIKEMRWMSYHYLSKDQQN